jgi:hypothetical protein
MGNRSRHLANRGQFLGLDQLRLSLFQLLDLCFQMMIEPGHRLMGTLQILGHPGERSSQLADLVLRADDRHLVIQMACAHHLHGCLELMNRTCQPPGDQDGCGHPEA